MTAGWHRPLMIFAGANAVMAVIAAVGLVVDDRVLGGAPIWLKPEKFSISFVLFGGTLAWMISLVQRRRRLAGRLGSLIVVMGVVEMVIIVGQVVRGRQSHFNTTTVLDGALWTIMGSAIVLLWLATLAVAVLLLRQKIADRALARAIRLGLVVSLVGMALAFFMTAPTPSQQEALGAGEVSLVGAHAVGVADGGPGLPVTGWSTSGGDLRIGHFVGMHALQGLPLLALVMTLLAPRWRRLDHEDVQVGLITVTAAAWLGLTLLLTWQALRGQPLLAPDVVTVGALVVLVVAWVIGLSSVIGRQRVHQT